MGGVSDRGEDLVYAAKPPTSYAPPPPPKPPAAAPPPPPPAPAPAGPAYSPAQLAAALATLRGNTPQPSVNPQTGTTLSGPNPVITDPFRHMFNTKQVYQYGLEQPKSIVVPQVSVKDGQPKMTYSVGTLDWWKPNSGVQFPEKK